MKVKARDFDKKFDEGADITTHLDVNKVRTPNLKRVIVDGPVLIARPGGTEIQLKPIPRGRQAK